MTLQRALRPRQVSVPPSKRVFCSFVSLAIEAMKNAHRTELEKELDKARKANSSTENADIEEIRRQHEYVSCNIAMNVVR